MPEAVHAMAQAAIYLSLAPKSNAAYLAIKAARAHVREHGAHLPPPPVRSAADPGAAALGRGQG
jgi:putative ATPase